MPIECKIEKKLILRLNIEGEDVLLFKKIVEFGRTYILENKRVDINDNTEDNTKMINLATLILKRYE
jgi:hypothetical protein